MITPIIELIATGSYAKKDHDILDKVITLIQQWGYRARYSPTLFGEHPLYANTDDYRLENLVQALYAEDSSIIWCLRGGSGTTRLIPFLETLAPPKHHKMLIGLSDVTALLLFLSQKWGWQPIHAPTAHYAALNKLTPDALDAVRQIIQGKTTEVHYEGLMPLNSAAKSSQVVEGLLTGGNLSLVEYSIGTSWQMDSRDRILFFEDINEPAYRIAERLEHLRQALLFHNAKGILFGDFFHEEADKYRPELVEFVLTEFSQKTEIPCFSGLPVGHRDFCRPLIVNGLAKLLTGSRGKLYNAFEID
jgi:muramoyltetrapeptide carboxypeptidase